MESNLSNELIIKKYKIYNIFHIIMIVINIFIVTFIIYEFIYSYFYGIKPNSLCGFSGGASNCKIEYGIDAIRSLELSLIIMMIYGSPFIIIYFVLCIVISLKYSKYKNLLHK